MEAFTQQQLSPQEKKEETSSKSLLGVQGEGLKKIKNLLSDAFHKGESKFSIPSVSTFNKEK